MASQETKIGRFLREESKRAPARKLFRVVRSDALGNETQITELETGKATARDLEDSIRNDLVDVTGPVTYRIHAVGDAGDIKATCIQKANGTSPEAGGNPLNLNAALVKGLVDSIGQTREHSAVVFQQATELTQYVREDYVNLLAKFDSLHEKYISLLLQQAKATPISDDAKAELYLQGAKTLAALPVVAMAIFGGDSSEKKALAASSSQLKDLRSACAGLSDDTIGKMLAVMVSHLDVSKELADCCTESERGPLKTVFESLFPKKG